jgi:hypothetical protein
MYGIELRTKEKQMNDVLKEYQNYRNLNDLDRYFVMNLNEESKERVL